ncbi:diphthine methyltransferase [Diachasma alloeum]|uniref:diphthine methyltransferase n=1 Tax=Diachasma alloeum TaxID=454923 RepID=UPI0007384338|nr:diphthine methyltransferase [Diachasma alloeum]
MFKILETFDTKFSADSVEWCPIEGFQDHFVCGTYELQKPEEQSESSDDRAQKRQGIIYLFRVVSPGNLHLLQQVNVPGVLDMKWAHVVYEGHILLGVVNSVGYLQLWELERESGKMSLFVETKLRSVDDEYLALSLDWSTGRSAWSHSTEVKITVSDSKGFITVYNVSQGKLNVLASQLAHEFEAWITAFNYWDTNVIYSGGDDCKFKWFDTRTGLQSVGSNKIHTAGVTSLHSNAESEFILASGSYDEILRLWDTRQMRRSISETNLNGGIWRLKWDPFHHKYLFAACMYSNFKIIDCQRQENPEIVAELNEHESIAYGCDWSSLSEDEAVNKLVLENCESRTVIAATCSFYDHTLKLSAVTLGN